MNEGMGPYWTVCDFAGLDTRLFHDILRLRVDVFVVEQHCPYAELDGLDPGAVHVIGRMPDGGPIAYCRILPAGADGLPHIGRVVVAPGSRGKGIGGRLMEEALQALETMQGSRRSALAAQAHLVGFYTRLGYIAIGEPYLLDDIPHVDMRMQNL